MNGSTTSPANPFLKRALPLLDRGFSLIPLLEHGKAPQSGIGTKSKSTDRAQIERWAEQFPDANVGVCADGQFLILDADDDVRLRELLQSTRGVSLPPTFTVESSPGRRHYYFRQTSVTLKQKYNIAIGALFELRHREQYVVGSGSIHAKTGQPYQVVNDRDPVPLPDSLFAALGYLKGEARIKTERTKIDITSGKKIREGEGRHYAILDFAAKNCTPGKSLEQQFAEAMEFNETYCDPPRDSAHVADIVNWFEYREPYDKGPAVIVGPSKPVDRSKPRYIVPAKDDSGNYGSWFPRGEVSLVCGASGSGKTVFTVRLLENLRKGLPVLNHPPRVAEYRLILADRSKADLKESTEGLEPDVQEILTRAVEADIMANEAPAVRLTALLQEWETAEIVPDIVCIEGADVWLPNADVSNPDAVKQFLYSLRQVAQSWNVAILGSVGSPKQKGRERYALARDQVIGTVFWGRMCSTILHIGLTNEQDPDSVRRVRTLPRKGRSESVWFSFEAGQLAFTDRAPDEPTLAGIAETAALNSDPDAELIAYLETLPAGSEVIANRLTAFGHANTVGARLARLSHPITGWVEKRGNRWVVRDRAKVISPVVTSQSEKSLVGMPG
jgi:hypothetical protein